MSNALAPSLLEHAAQRLVVLRPDATAVEAAHAMEDNHVGAILVVDGGHLVGIVTDRDLALGLARPGFDPRATRVERVMTDVVGSCEGEARLADVLCTMRQYACRRVPVIRGGKPVELVSLDDLILDGEATLAEIRAVVQAQLEQPSRLKPAGARSPDRVHDRCCARERRRSARAESDYRDLVRGVERVLGPRAKRRAEAALKLVLTAICRRLDEDHVRPLVSALPERVAAEIAPDPPAPHGAVAEEDPIAVGLARLELPPDAAVDILLYICDAIADGTFAGSAEGVRSRLFWYARELFPKRRARAAASAQGAGPLPSATR